VADRQEVTSQSKHNNGEYGAKRKNNNPQDAHRLHGDRRVEGGQAKPKALYFEVWPLSDGSAVRGLIGALKFGLDRTRDTF